MKARMLLVGLLCTVGTLGCGDKPAPVAEPKPVVEPEPVADEADQSPPELELGRDAVIAEIEKLGGRCEFGKEKCVIKVFLSKTEVTDAGLEHIKGLTKLEMLDLRKTRVTDEGVKRLEEGLPDCLILR